MKRSRALLFAGVIGLAAAAAAVAADWAKLVDQRASAIVGLRVTVKSEMEGGGGPGQESTDEILGAVVDPSGLILCWNSSFSAGRMSELFSGMGDSGARMKVTPTDIRVTIPGDPKEYSGFLAASDSDLDLAFVQLDEKPAQPLASIDFTKPGQVRLGDEVAAVARLTSAFDHAPYFDVVRVTGEVRKPRTAWIVGGGNATQVGLPYFSPDGQPAGVLVTVLSRSGTASSPNPSKMFADLLSLGRGSSEVGPLGLFLLPAERIRPVIDLARERAAELLSEREKAPAPAKENP